MNPNEIKYIIENRDKISEELNSIFSSLPSEAMDEFSNLVEEGDIEGLLKLINNMAPNSNISALSFKIMLYLDDVRMKDKLFSEEEYSDFITKLAELYGDKVFEIIPIKDKNFRISDLNCLLANDKDKYSDIYKSALLEKIEKATFSDFIELLKVCDQSMITEEQILNYIDSDNMYVSDENSLKLVEVLDSSMLQDGIIGRKLVEKMNSIINPQFIDYFPIDLFTGEFVSELIDKSNNFPELFRYIPEEAKSKEVWEVICQKKPSYIGKVPKENFDSNSNQEEYDLWFEKLLSDTVISIQNENDILEVLKEGITRDKLTEEIWYEILYKCIQLNFDRHNLSNLDISKIIPGIIDRPIKDEDELRLYQLLTKEERKIYSKFAANNAFLYKTLKIEILDPKIVSVIGEDNLERLVQYEDIQESILSISKDESALKTLKVSLDFLRGDNKFIEPLIEKLCESINKQSDSNFLKSVSERINNNDLPLSEYERTIISFLALNPIEGKKIEEYDDIMTFVERKNNELESIINDPNATLNEVKYAFIERFFGLNYISTIHLISTYGSDAEELFKNYENISSDSYIQLQEKEAIEILSLLKMYSEETDIQAFKKDFDKLLAEEKMGDSKRFEVATILENALKRAYGRDMASTLQTSTGNVEIEEKDYNGIKYTVHKVSGEFDRMIHVMGAYFEDTATDDDLYERWNNNELVRKHVLCFSLIDESMTGTALEGDNKKIIISIDNFGAESLVESGPRDLGSAGSKNTVESTNKTIKFHTAKNMPNETVEYSEYVIEVKDILSEGDEYKKIQPTSIICFEEVDEESIKAAIQFGKELGHPIPIELIDRRELAKVQMDIIEKDLEELKNSDSFDINLVKDIIIRFGNVRTSHLKSNLNEELIGNDNAPFNTKNLLRILEECISSLEKRVMIGQIQNALEIIAEIKKLVEHYGRITTDYNIEKLFAEKEKQFSTQDIYSEENTSELEKMMKDREIEEPVKADIYL